MTDIKRLLESLRKVDSDPMGCGLSNNSYRTPDHTVDQGVGVARSQYNLCDGCGWVCENHPNLSWEPESDSPYSCGCGAGMQCPGCKACPELKPKHSPDHNGIIEVNPDDFDVAKVRAAQMEYPMTNNNELEARIAEILAADPVCGGRVSSGAVAAIAALFGPSNTPTQGADMTDIVERQAEIDAGVEAYIAQMPQPDMLQGALEDRKFWIREACRFSRNEDYYRGLLDECANHIGTAAFTADDGSVSQSPIRAKIPDLIEKHRAAVEVLREALEPFAMCPTVGKRGGRFVIAHAFYADMKQGDAAPRAAHWHSDQFVKARKAFASIGDVGER